MSAPLRLLVFGAALAAVFTLSLFGARTLLPAAESSSEAAGHTRSTDGGSSHAEETGMDHTAPANPSATALPSDSAPDPVRGLSVAEGGYQLEAVTGPTRTGETGPLSFRLTGPGGKPVAAYNPAHEKDLHLIVVRSDGSQFRHVHPVHDGNGGWSLPWRWTAAGSYRVFADFVPAGRNQPLTLTSTLDVAGVLKPVLTTGTEAGAVTGADVATVEGFTVTLTGQVRAGQESMLRFTVARDGQPVTTLQPYLGAAGHLVALRAGDLAYLHVHPMGEASPAGGSGPEIEFMATTPSPGRYLLYLDFQVDGQVHTATFTVTATR